MCLALSCVALCHVAVGAGDASRVLTASADRTARVMKLPLSKCVPTPG